MRTADKLIRLSIVFCLVAFISGSSVPGLCRDLDIGFILTDDTGTILSRQNQDKALVPASTIKILTSLAAFHIFTEDYRFVTRYFLKPETHDLYIKGFGDPLFISEVIANLSREIKTNLYTTEIRHIICDNSYFSSRIQIPGRGNSLNPYDASIGALCANFNTINFLWNKNAGKFTSAEPQTPLLPIFDEKIKKTGLKEGRIVLSGQESLMYPGRLIQYFLNRHQIKTTGSILEGTLPGTARAIFEFQSPYTVRDLVQKLLEYSNNFIANQLLLSLGAAAYGPPATIEKGVRSVKTYAQKILNTDNMTIVEGSGLSRKNKITPYQMIIVLKHFAPYYLLLNQKGSDFYKTGTLTGIRTRAGFLMGKNSRLYPYVIMINKKGAGYEKILDQFKRRVAMTTEKTPD